MLVKNHEFQDFRCVVAALREAVLNLLERTPTSKEIGGAFGDARWGPAFFAFIFTAALGSTEAAVFVG